MSAIKVMRKLWLFILAFYLWSFPFSSIGFASNFPHIKTFGFDYLDFVNRQDQAAWVATKHDWIIGPSAGAGNIDTDRMEAAAYNAFKGANPDVKLMMYMAYNTILEDYVTWLESWCVANGHDPEDLYYHYYYDTTINTTQGEVTVPGFGGGTAATLSAARVKAIWWGGQFPNINPSSTTFRRAYEAMALEMVTIKDLSNIYADGLFLDTFNGTSEPSYWDLHLENSIEMRGLGHTTSEAARSQACTDTTAAYTELQAFLRVATGNNEFVVLPNAAEPDYVYSYRADLFQTHAAAYDYLCMEYLITSAKTWMYTIPRMQEIYDDLVSGTELWIRSQTNYSQESQAIPLGFTQFILATHYAVNHANAHFMYHQGSAASYGGAPFGDLTLSHWHPNLEVDIGSPVARTGEDYWGETNTDRFFIFDQGANYKIVAREYDNALVLAKFGDETGWANIGKNPLEHNLEGTYYRLLADNSLGPAITTITLGFGEGAILIKNPEQLNLEQSSPEEPAAVRPNPPVLRVR